MCMYTDIYTHTNTHTCMLVIQKHICCLGLLQRERRWEETQAGDRVPAASGWCLRQSVEALPWESNTQTRPETSTHLCPGVPCTHHLWHTHNVTAPLPGPPRAGRCGRGWTPWRAGGDHTAVDPEWRAFSGSFCPLWPSPPLKGADHSTFPTLSPGEKAKIKHTLLKTRGQVCPEVRDAGTRQGLTQGDGPRPVPPCRTQLEKALQK